jgi:GntR family transcriptional regulator/MocR family aminotransferase
MANAIIYLDPDSELNLQAQIRQKLVDAIVLGTFPEGERLPSSRKLADQLGVARNTVVLAYQQLIDEGYLISRERSGLYVNEKVRENHANFTSAAQPVRELTATWRRRFKGLLTTDQAFAFPHNWQQYPYPFLEGQFDHSLYPVREWREASRLALGVREINEWAGETGDLDDPMLIEQIRTKILPRRGIQARPEEILITVGTQQALHLVVELLVDSSVPVAVEEPGYPSALHPATRPRPRLPCPWSDVRHCWPGPGLRTVLLSRTITNSKATTSPILTRLYAVLIRMTG